MNNKLRQNVLRKKAFPNMLARTCQHSTLTNFLVTYRLHCLDIFDFDWNFSRAFHNLGLLPICPVTGGLSFSPGCVFLKDYCQPLYCILRSVIT